MDIKAMMQSFKEAFSTFLYGTLTVAAGAQNTTTIAVTSDGHFRLKWILGSYTTQVAGPADGGANLTSLQLLDNGRGGAALWDTLIPCHLFMSPGRQRVSAVAGDPSNALFFPMEFNYLFLANTTIQMIGANAAGLANRIDLLLVGEKIPVTNGNAESVI